MTLSVISTMDGTSITSDGTVIGESDSSLMSLHDPYTLQIGGGGDGGNRGCRTTIGNVIGSSPGRYYKFYVEVNTALGNGNPSFPNPQNATWGLASASADLSGFDEGEHDVQLGLLSYELTGNIYLNGTQVATAGEWINGTVAEGMFDIAAGTAAFRIKGDDWTGPIDISSLGGRVYVFGGMQARFILDGQWLEFNMGQKAFADTVPTGFQPGWGTPDILIGVLTWDGNRIAR